MGSIVLKIILHSLFSGFIIMPSYILETVECIRFKRSGESIVIRADKAKEITLNCPYELDPDDINGLVISWHYNDLPYPVYQWIPPQKPQALGFLKDFVDLSYVSSQSDYYKHQSIRLSNPTTNLTGVYECRVSSFSEEKRYVVSVILFATPLVFDVTVERENDHSIKVKCYASSVYPEPRMQLFWAQHSKRIPLSNGRLNTKWTRGAYDISLQAVIEDNQLDDITSFECHLTIPNTDISCKKNVKYIPNNLENIYNVYTLSSANSIQSSSLNKIGIMGHLSSIFTYKFSFVIIVLLRSFTNIGIIYL